MNHRNRFPARRRFLKQSAALSAGASLAAPAAVLAHVQHGAFKLGLLHPVSGPEAALGRACREAALLALHEVNQARAAQRRLPLLAVCADAAVHAQPGHAVAALQAHGVSAALALLPGLPPSAQPLADAHHDAHPAALLRLAPAALACGASAACTALLQSRPAADQLAVASTYAAVRAIDSVLPDGDAAGLADALRAAGLVQPLLTRATADLQTVLLLPAVAAAPLAAGVRSRRA